MESKNDPFVKSNARKDAKNIEKEGHASTKLPTNGMLEKIVPTLSKHIRDEGRNPVDVCCDLVLRVYVKSGFQTKKP